MAVAGQTTGGPEAILERLYERYNHREFVGLDPLAFLYKYDSPRDIEIVGFLAAAMAYGRVEQITRSLTDLLGRMGRSPYEFAAGFGKKERQKLAGFKHRFNTGEDIADLLAVFRKMLVECGSIEGSFLKGYGAGEATILPALEAFCSGALAMHKELSGRDAGTGLQYLLTRPSGGSPCKRMNLFLRWMVRKDEVDLGTWKSVDKSRLVVPVDVHMGRLSAILGLHSSKNVTLKTATEITKGFAAMAPGDPVKYDFALCRVGIYEGCTGKPQEFCERCELMDLCRKRTTAGERRKWTG
jgi:uncharacterized protein (TIGR02757 family)